MSKYVPCKYVSKLLRLFLVNNMQTLLPSEVSEFHFWFEKMRNVLKRIQKQFSDFLIFFSSNEIFISSFWVPFV